MLTSPIKPPLPSPSPSPRLSAPAPFSLPAYHLNLPAAPRETSGNLPPALPRCSSRDSPAATVLSAAQPILLVFLVLAFIIKKFEKNRRCATGCLLQRQQEPLMLRYVTFYEGGRPRKPVPSRSSVLIRTFILPDRSCVKSYVDRLIRKISVTTTIPRSSKRRSRSVIVTHRDLMIFQILMPMY